MMNKITRRTFLKTAGTAVLAVAAAGALTACSEDGSVPAPVQTVQVNPTSVYNSIWYNDKEMTQVYATFANAEFEITNKGTSDITVDKSAFAMELDGSSVEIDKFALKGGNGYSEKKEVQIKPGEKCTVRVCHKLDAATKEAFEKWDAESHKVKVTIRYNGQAWAYTGDTHTRQFQ